MGKIKSIGKKVLAGTTTAGVGLAGTIGGHFLFRGGEAGEAGAIVDLQEDSAMVLYDLYGKAAFLNYFGANPQAPLSMKVSITTTDDMPAKMQDSMGQLTKFRQDHVSRKVDPQDFRAITPESAEVIRGFFREFEELTGIHVEVVENDPDAAIAIGGYISHDEYIGFASFPQEIPVVGLLPQNQGFLMLDVDYMAERLAAGKPESVQALVSHEFGHNLGLLHPFDGLVSTALSEQQKNGVSRMAYNNHTFPPIAETSIDSGYGPLDIYHIRQALKERGFTVPAIHPGDDEYLLGVVARETVEGAKAKSGRLYQIPALSLLDTGGRNTLTATDGDDLLVTEAGYCGLINRQEQRLSLLRDGQPYCLVEGEFSVVKSGDGNDLILTAIGTEQDVYLASGKKDVAVLEQDIGDIRIHTEAEHAPDNIGESVGTVLENALGLEDETTLTLHQSLFDRSTVQARAAGEDIVLDFAAFSGRELGSVTLKGQAGKDGEGIDTLRVIDNSGGTLVSFDVAQLHDPAQWQEQVLDSIDQKAREEGRQWARAEIAKTRQALAGSAGKWTEILAEEQAAGESHGETPRKDTGHSDGGKVVSDETHEGYLRRRRAEETKVGKKGIIL